MSRTSRLCIATWAITFVLALATLLPNLASKVEAQTNRNLTVLVGAGQDTSQALAFFPQNIRIRQGDTVTWQINGDEVHTASFVKGFDPGPNGVSSPLEPAGSMIPGPFAPIPGAPPEAQMLNPQVAWPTRAPGAPVERYTGTGFASSGVFTKESPMPGVPANDTFQLSFPTPGTYMYLCLIHTDRMYGYVDVRPSDATDVDTQATVDSQANREIAAALRLIQVARAQGDQLAKSDPGPNNTTTWYIRAGNEDFESGDSRALYMDFQPKNLTINAGDTVIWSSNYFHSITFTPTPPFPEWLIPMPGADGGPPILALNPQIATPIKPSATYDPTQYFNSGILGPFTPFGQSWSLTFNQPGTFDYSCQVHEQLGMKGTITVQASQAEEM